MNPIRVGDDRHHVTVQPGGPDQDDLTSCLLLCNVHGRLRLEPSPIDIAVVAAAGHLDRPILTGP